jgi:hypothetical protein
LWVLSQPLAASAPKIEYGKNEMAMVGQNSLLPIAGIKEEMMLATVTMYNNLSWQTDSTPNITASNSQVREGIVANNCLEFGTLVEIGGKTYIVEDRLNARFNNCCECFDIFSFDLKEAIQYGRQQKIVKIYE